MKVTYVVERGSLCDVAYEITAAAMIRFTDALSRSNAEPLLLVSLVSFQRVDSHFFSLCGRRDKNAS